MELLQNVIASLQREILAALARETDLPDDRRLVAERITLNLSFSIQEQKTANGATELKMAVLRSSADGESAVRGDGPFHNLQIEFKVERAGQPHLEPAAEQAPSLDAASAHRLADSLDLILGAPGFDSSARATVFREALTELSDEQTRGLGNRLRGAPGTESDPETAHAGHLLTRLANTGPAGPVRGRELLAEILRQHPRKALLVFLKDRWKSQEEWLK